jgi:hypothetical protein
MEGERSWNREREREGERERERVIGRGWEKENTRRDEERGNKVDWHLCAVLCSILCYFVADGVCVGNGVGVKEMT